MKPLTREVSIMEHYDDYDGIEELSIVKFKEDVDEKIVLFVTHDTKLFHWYNLTNATEEAMQVFFHVIDKWREQGRTIPFTIMVEKCDVALYLRRYLEECSIKEVERIVGSCYYFDMDGITYNSVGEPNSPRKKQKKIRKMRRNEVEGLKVYDFTEPLPLFS